MEDRLRETKTKYWVLNEIFIAAGDDATVSFWMKHDSVTNWVMMVGKYDADNYFGYCFQKSSQQKYVGYPVKGYYS